MEAVVLTRCGRASTLQGHKFSLVPFSLLFLGQANWNLFLYPVVYAGALLVVSWSLLRSWVSLPGSSRVLVDGLFNVRWGLRNLSKDETTVTLPYCSVFPLFLVICFLPSWIPKQGVSISLCYITDFSRTWKQQQFIISCDFWGSWCGSFVPSGGVWSHLRSCC